MYNVPMKSTIDHMNPLFGICEDTNFRETPASSNKKFYEYECWWVKRLMFIDGQPKKRRETVCNWAATNYIACSDVPSTKESCVALTIFRTILQTFIEKVVLGVPVWNLSHLDMI